jgi:hypothetical protein
MGSELTHHCRMLMVVQGQVVGVEEELGHS